MAKAQNKTTQNDNSVADFLASVADDRKRADSEKIVKIFSEQTGFESKMWGSAIIGFGSYHYKYESGREGDAPLAGFSPRKQNIALYLAEDYEKRDALMAKLGKHKTGKVCVYINKLDDIDIDVLKKMINASTEYMKREYPNS